MTIKELKKAIEHIDERAEVYIRFPGNEIGDSDFVVPIDTVALCIDEDNTPSVEIYRRDFK